MDSSLSGTRSQHHMLQRPFLSMCMHPKSSNGSNQTKRRDSPKSPCRDSGESFVGSGSKHGERHEALSGTQRHAWFHLRGRPIDLPDFLSSLSFLEISPRYRGVPCGELDSVCCSW